MINMLKFPRLLVNHVKALATPTSSSNADYLSQQTRVIAFIIILSVVKRNPLFFHSILFFHCKNNGFLFTIIYNH